MGDRDQRYGTLWDNHCTVYRQKVLGGKTTKIYETAFVRFLLSEKNLTGAVSHEGSHPCEPFGVPSCEKKDHLKIHVNLQMKIIFM